MGDPGVNRMDLQEAFRMVSLKDDPSRDLDLESSSENTEATTDEAPKSWDGNWAS